MNVKYETMKEAGYTYCRYDSSTKEHILIDNDTRSKEVFIANKNHAGWGIRYKNTHLEFCRTLR
jgi:hypothetical protein